MSNELSQPHNDPWGLKTSILTRRISDKISRLNDEMLNRLTRDGSSSRDFYFTNMQITHVRKISSAILHIIESHDLASSVELETSNALIQGTSLHFLEKHHDSTMHTARNTAYSSEYLAIKAMEEILMPASATSEQKQMIYYNPIPRDRMEQLIEQGMFQQLPSVMSSQRLYVKLPTIIPDLAVVYRYGIAEDTPTRLVRLIPTPPSQPQ